MNILHYIPSGWDNFIACVWMWNIWAIYVLGPAFSSLFWHLSAICIALKPNAMGTKFCQNGDPFFLVKSGPNGNLRQQNMDPISKIEGNKPIRWNRGETSYLQSGPKNWKRSPWEQGNPLGFSDIGTGCTFLSSTNLHIYSLQPFHSLPMQQFSLQIWNTCSL